MTPQIHHLGPVQHCPHLDICGSLLTGLLASLQLLYNEN